jgi:DNA modification methylase
MVYIKLIHSDAIDGMQSLEDESIDLVVTSPP